jgi:hypothetical protein
MQDACMTTDAQGQFHAAAAAAQQHHQHILQLLQSQQQQQPSAAVPQASRATGGSSSGSSSGSIGGSSGGGWCAVQTAAHHVLASYRSATLRLQQLACLAEGREKQLHDIQQLQQQQQQNQSGGRSSSQASSPARGNMQASPVLTAFELHLLLHPVLLQQHAEALQQAVSCLLQQQECKQHAAVFFAWATSAIAEAQQQLQGGGNSVAAASHTGTSSSSSSSRTITAQQQHRQQSTSSAFPAPALQDVLSLVQQLPAADTALAAGVLGLVHKQLQQEAAAAGVVRMEAGFSSSSQQQPKGHSIRLGANASAHQNHHCCHADQLSQGLAGLDLEPSMQGLQQAGHVAAFIQTAAAAIVKAGVLPGTMVQGLQHLPADIQEKLEQGRAARAEKADQKRAEQAARQDMMAYSSLRRKYQHPQQQQQQRHGDRAGLHDSSGGSGGPDGVHVPGPDGVHVPVSGELQRLNGVALHVAKLLAKARAANKQQLAAAAQLLVEAGEAVDGGRLVVYQP